MSVKRSVVDAEAFFSALKLVGRVPRDSVLPAAEFIQIRFYPDSCQISGTDLDTWLSIHIPAKGEALSFAVSGYRQISRAFRNSRGEMLIELDERDAKADPELTVTLTCGDNSAQFSAKPADDCPQLPEIHDSAAFSMDASLLKRRVSRVIYAAGEESKNRRPQSYSVGFRGHQIFALDGMRMACDTDPDMKVPRPFLLPAKGLTHLSAFSGVEVSFRFHDDLCEISDPNTALFLHMPADTVLNVPDVLPKQAGDQLLLSPKVFLEKLSYLKNALSPAKDFVIFDGRRLTAESSGMMYQTTLAYSGVSTVSFRFRASYMEDAMRQFRTEPVVRLKVSGQLSPLIIEADGRTDFALVLPARMPEKAAAA